MTDKIRQAAEECAQEVFNAGPEWPAVKCVTPIIAFHMQKLLAAPPNESQTPAIEEDLVAALAKQLHHHLSAAQNLAWEEGDTCGDCIDDVRDICMPIIRAYVAERVAEAEQQSKKFTYCAYCGHTESVDVDGEIIAQHIRTCEKHPLNIEIANLKAQQAERVKEAEKRMSYE